MPQFISSQSSLPYYLNPNWHTAIKFNSKDRIVSKDGKDYKLFSKLERQFGIVERIARFALGALCCAATFGLTYRCKSIQKLLWKDKATVRIGMLQQASATPFDPQAYFISTCQKNPAFKEYFKNHTADKFDFARFLTEKGESSQPITQLNAQDL